MNWDVLEANIIRCGTFFYQLTLKTVSYFVFGSQHPHECKDGVCHGSLLLILHSIYCSLTAIIYLFQLKQPVNYSRVSCQHIIRWYSGSKPLRMRPGCWWWTLRPKKACAACASQPRRRWLSSETGLHLLPRPPAPLDSLRSHPTQAKSGRMGRSLWAARSRSLPGGRHQRLRRR